MDAEVKISIGVDVAAAVTKLGGFAKDLEAATNKSTALQKSLAAVGIEDMKGLSPQIVTQIENTNRSMIELAQTAGLTKNQIEALSQQFGGAIGNAASLSAVEHARTQLMSMGVAAGLSASDLQKMGASIGMSAKETEAHTMKVSGSFAKMAEASGMNAAQLANVTRILPMQFTDIVTSLASGMPAYMVAIQQGGQIKDMYGSMGLAARALSEYVLGLISPFTIAAAAVGVLALAYNQGSREADAYRLALVNTGNAAGLTTGQLAGMAQHIGDSVGTVGGAAAALAALSATGEVAGANMEKFAQSAIYAQKGLKQDVEDTAKVFAQLGESPVQASAKLNEKLNYLSAATFAQIKAAQDLGDKETAASIAQNAYADAVKVRYDKVINAMGPLERQWMDVASAAKKAWDSMLDIGREEDPVAKLKILQDKLQKVKTGMFTDYQGIAALKTQIADQEKLVAIHEKKNLAENAFAKAQAENAKKDKKNIWLQQQKDNYLEDYERIGRNSKKLRKEWADAGATPEEINKALGIMNRPLAAQALQRTDEFYKEYTAIIKDGEKLAQNELSGQHAAGLIADIDFYTKKQTLAANSVTDQMAVIELEIAATKKSGIGYAEKASKLAAFNAQYSALEREQVAIAQQAGIDIAAAKRKEEQRSAAESIKDATESLEAWHKLALVKDAEYYANNAKNDADYWNARTELAFAAYENETRYALEGSQVEIDARQKLNKVLRDGVTERELANKNALASAFEYGRTVDLSLQRQAYESSLVLQTSEERTKLLAIYDIEAQKLEKIRQIMATTPEGKDRDKSIADIEAAAARAKQGEVSKALNNEWKTHLDFAEGVAKGIWDDYTSGAGNAAQNALNKIKKELFDELYKYALKPLVLNVLANITGNPVGGASASITGGGGGGIGGTLMSAAGNAVGGIEIGGSTLSAWGGGIAGGFKAGITGNASSFMGPTLPGFEAGAALAEAVPYVAAAYAAYKIIDSFSDNNVKVGGDYQYTAGAGIDKWRDEAGRTRLGTNGIEIGDNLIQKGVQATTDGINKLFKQLGSSEVVKTFIGGAQSSSEKAEAYKRAEGVTASGIKFGIEGEQKLGKTASPEEVIAEYQKGLNRATIDAIQKATDIPIAAKEAIAKINPDALGVEQFQIAIAGAVKQAQTAIAQEITGLDVSKFGDLMRGMADDGINAAEYMTDGMSQSIQGAMAGKLQSDFNSALYDAIILPMATTHTFSKAAAESIIADLQAKTAALKTLFSSDEFKSAMADMGSVLAEAQAPMRELNSYIPQTSKSVKSLADTASSASKDIADAAKKEADERKGLQDKLDNLTMTRAELLAKERDAVAESNRALFDQLKAREAFDAANKLAQAELAKQAGLRADLIEARGDSVAATEMRRVAAIKAATEGMNEYNAELVSGAMIATNALEDQVNAAKELQSITNSLGDKFSGLQVDLLTAKGDEAGAKRLKRQQELDALLLNKSDADAAEIKNLYYRNAGIEDQIELANKSKKSAEDAAKAWEDSQQKARDAAKEAANAWKDIGKTLEDEIKRLRGELFGNTAQGLAQAQADFAIAQAQAAAGDKEAAGKLPELSSRVVEIAKNMGMAGADLRQIQGETAMSLEYVQSAAKARADALLKQADTPIAPMPFATVAPVLVATNKAASNDLSLALTGVEKKLDEVINQSITNNNQLATVVRQSAALPVTVSGVVRTV